MKTFEVVVTYSGYDREKDNKILSSLERRDRRLFSGTGFNLLDGGRDLFFVTCKKEIAERLQKNLRNAVKKNRFRAKVSILHDHEW